MEDIFNDFVARSAGSVQEYLSAESRAEQVKIREFLGQFYAGSQYMSLMTEADLVTLSAQVHGNLVYQTFVYDLQMSVLAPVGRQVTEQVIEQLAYGIAPMVEYPADKNTVNFSVGPTDDSRFKVTDQDIIQRIRANRWLLPLLVLAWAEPLEAMPDGTD